MKHLILSLLLTVSLSAYCDTYEYPYLLVETSDGNETKLAVESLQLSFDSGSLTATNAEGTVSFVLTNLKRMYFTNSSTAIENIQLLNEEEVEVFSVTGQSLGRYANISKASAALASGIYMMKTSIGTIKVNVK